MNTKLTFFGHATVSLTCGENTIFIDPWLEGNPLCPDDYSQPNACDLIVLTHGHDDHASSAVSLAKRTGARICATFELAELLRKDGVSAEQLQHMNKGGTVSVADGIEVTLTNAFHSSSYTMNDGTVCYAGEACGAVIRLPSGAVVYHAGDTCLFEDMKHIGKRYKPSLACLPIGDCFTMGPEEAAQAAKLLGAPRVLPIHYGTFDALTGTVAAFKEALGSDGPTCEACEPGQGIEL